MRILGHIHSWNDEEVIDRSLEALLAQSRSLDGILIVDNASTDSTLEREFPEQVHVIRNRANLGTSGAVAVGFRYAIEHDYDWIWVFDADTAPRPEALETLLALFESLSDDVKAKVSVLASLPIDTSDGQLCYGLRFTSRGVRRARPEPGAEHYPFHGGIWTGCLFRIEAVRAIGIPSENYVLDWGEFEYGYRAMRSGFLAFMHTKSIVDHNIGGEPGLKRTSRRIGPVQFSLKELPPIRCYYLVRNILYFWLYEFHERNVHTLFACFVHVSKFMGSYTLAPVSNGSRMRACFRGLWDGMFKRMHRRF
jgi:rhamnosyltransferase